MGDAAEKLPDQLPPQARFSPDRGGIKVGVRQEIEPHLGNSIEVGLGKPIPHPLVPLKGGLEKSPLVLAVTNPGDPPVPVPQGETLEEVQALEEEMPLDEVEETVAEDLYVRELEAENQVLGRLVAKLYAENEVLKKKTKS